MSEFANLNDLMFPGLPPGNNEHRFPTASKTIHNVTVPTPSLPDGFDDSNAYLRHLVHEGAINRYGCVVPQNVEERINPRLCAALSPTSVLMRLKAGIPIPKGL